MLNNRGKAMVLAKYSKEKKADGYGMEGEEPESMESEGMGMAADPAGMLCHLLGMLLAMRQNYHSSHWQVSGPTFAGDHELFNKLYSSVGEEIDTLAEKIVAKYGADKVDATKLSHVQTQQLAGWAGQTDPFQRGLASEKALQATLKQVYDALKESGNLSLGMDDYLMATANSHETNEYLLGQRTKGATPMVSVLRKGM